MEEHQTDYKKKKTKKYQEAYVSLLTVLIVGAVALVLASSMILISISSSRNSLTIEQSSRATEYANLCAEYALQQIKVTSGSYTGNETLSLANGSCTIEATTGSAPNITVKASGTSGNSKRKVSVVTSQVTPQIFISSWQEVADF